MSTLALLITLVLIVEEEEGVLDPNLLKKIDRFQKEVAPLANGGSKVGYTNSYLDIIKEFTKS